MCRLFAYRGREPFTVQRSLLDAENALEHQSHEHGDGWGLAFYADGETRPRLFRGVDAAWRDPVFRDLCSTVTSRTIVAHVRKATVGDIGEDNSHPFRHGQWAFAHNGTVLGWQAVRERVEEGIREDLRPAMRGDTDSERLFFLVLTELGRAGVDIDAPCDALPASETVTACGRVCQRLLALTGGQEGGRATALNFLLTNGRVLLAHRLGRDLHYSIRKHRCAFQAFCPVRDKVCLEARPTDGPRTHLLVASERLSDEDVWEEVPERGVLLADAALRVRLHRWSPDAGAW